MAVADLDLGRYQLGWSDAEDYVFKPKRGLNEDIVREMSWMKGEPEWMLDFRLKSLRAFEKRPMPNWGGDMSEIYFDDIYYYIKPTEPQVDDWDDLPDAIKNTYEKLGIPEAERKYLAGVTAQYESEVVFHRNREDLERQGVIFCDMDTALREYPELVKQYFGTVIPRNDNKFSVAQQRRCGRAAASSTCPPGVNVEMPLQAYFRINAENMGQFERTLIIADEGSQRALHRGLLGAGVHVRLAALGRGRDHRQGERPASPTRRSRTGRTTSSTWSPSGPGSRPRATWSGSTATSAPRSTMKYPSVVMVGPKASGEVLSVAYAGPGQHQDTGVQDDPRRARRPRRRSCRSRSRRTAAAPRTAAWSGSSTTPTAARATCSATR